MHSIRYIKACYFAAFVLGAAIALLVSTPVRATEAAAGATGDRAAASSSDAPDAGS